ncbi:MAG: alkane 1-monooxygenase [Bdellovibrionales bacterium]|nr:alkane 1-monooxygenase [Bdellovibrionales bacterium]
MKAGILFGMYLLFYLIPYEITAVAWSQMERGGPWTWAGVVLTFIVHPIADHYRADPFDQEKCSKALHKWGDVLLVGFFPLQLLFLARTLQLFANSPWNSSWWGAVLSTGLICSAFGITAAHELVHRKSRIFRTIGVAFLGLVNYAHFRVEHVHGHHKTVATPEDPATSRRGENIYQFVVRSAFWGYLSAWRLETRRLKSRKLPERILSHRCLHYLGLYLILSTWIIKALGWNAFYFWVFQSGVAIAVLEAVNYIEHYGLVRRQKPDTPEYEPVTARHSWDCNFLLTNGALFNLGLHNHHHKSPSVTYDRLKQTDTSPQMPYGYTRMILIALIPPLWFSQLHPILDGLSQEHS